MANINEKKITTETQITRIFTEDHSVFLSALRASMEKQRIKIIHPAKV